MKLSIKQFFCRHYWITGEYKAVEEILGIEIRKIIYKNPICMYCNKKKE